MAAPAGTPEGAQLLLVTGLTLCFTLVLVGSSLAPTRSQGLEPGYVPDLNYVMTNVEHEFPLALKMRMETDQVQAAELEITVRELFNTTAALFTDRLVERGLLLAVQLESFELVPPAHYRLNWTYTLTDGNGNLQVADQASYPLRFGEPWWAPTLNYRQAVEVSLPHPDRPVPLGLELNFTTLLGRLGRTGSFDPTSLRVVGQDPGTGGALELVAGFVPGADYLAQGRAHGTVVWTSHPDHSRYYLYFDTTDHQVAERPAAATGQLVVDQGTGRFSNAQLDWRLVDNSLLRIGQYIAATGARTGWSFNNSLDNWTLERVVVNTPAQVTVELSQGQLTRRYTLWEGSPLIAWEDISGISVVAGPLVKPFSELLSGSQGAYNYSLLNRTSAYLAVAVPSAGGSISLTNGTSQVLAANASAGYYIMDNRAPFAAADVEAYLKNLQEVQIENQVVQRLSD